MRKPHKFDVMSSKICACGKAIKQNVIDRQPNAKLCFECYRVTNCITLSTAREVRTGKRIGRKKGIYVID